MKHESLKLNSWIKTVPLGSEASVVHFFYKNILRWEWVHITGRCFMCHYKYMQSYVYVHIRINNTKHSYYCT